MALLGLLVVGVPGALATYGPPGKLDGNSPVTREQVAEGQARAATGGSGNGSAASPTQASASRSAYADESPAGALASAQTAFPGLLTAPVFSGLILQPGQSVARYVGDYSAQISGPHGHGTAVISTMPLMGKTPSGAKAPVDLRLIEKAGGFVPRSAGVAIVLPGNATGTLRFLDLGFGLRLVGAVDQPGALTHDRVWFGDVHGRAAAVDAWMSADRLGAEISFLLRTAYSPEDQRLAFDLPAGGRLSLDGKPGQQMVSVLGADGATIGRVLAPVTVDAAGKPVPTTYSLEGADRLVIHVAHHEGSYTYPIASDPLVASWRPGMYSAWSWWGSPGFSGGGDSSAYTYTSGPTTIGQGASGDFGYWSYPSVSGAYIYEAFSYLVYHFPNTSEEYGGIANASLSAWEPGSWQDTCAPFYSCSGASGSGGPEAHRFQAVQEQNMNTDYCVGGSAGSCLPPAHGTVASPTYAEIASLYMLGSVTAGYVPKASVYGAAVYESDDAVPSLSVPSHSDPHVGANSGTWEQTLNDTVGETASVSTGLGMAYTQITSNTGGYGGTASTACSSYPCALTQTSSIYPYINDGAATLTSQAVNSGGNASNTQSWVACQDTRKPVTSESGSLWSAPQGVVLPGVNTLNVSASDGVDDGVPNDQQSGVAGIYTTITPVGNPNQILYQNTTSGTGGVGTGSRCGTSNASGGQSDTVDTTNWTPGQYTLTVRVPDTVGNTKIDTQTLNLVSEANVVPTAQGIVTGAVNEVGCVQGQVSNPNPSSGDQACQAVGTAVGTADLEVACAQSQTATPHGSNDPVCNAAGTVVTTERGAVATAQNLVNQECRSQLYGCDPNAIASTVVGIATGELGVVTGEAGCVQGQLANPGAKGDTACQAVGTAVSVERSEVAYTQQEAGCVQSYASGSNPSTSGLPICQATIVAASTAKGTVATASAVLTGVVGTLQAEATCIVGQASSPGPSADPVCNAVSTGVGTAKNEAAYAQQESACVQGYANGGTPSTTGLPVCQAVISNANTAKSTVATATGIITGAVSTVQQEAGCVQGQVNNPSSNGDTACQAVGSASQIAHGEATALVQEATCTEGQVTSPSSSGDTVCQAVGQGVTTGKGLPSTVSGLGSQLIQQLVGTPGDYSDSCSSPAATVADGYAGSGTYVRLRVQPSTSDPSTEWVCYRISNPNAGYAGGRLDIKSPGVSPGVPSPDSNSSACQTAGYAAPPVQGTLLSMPFLVGASAPAGAGWVCVQVGSEQLRVIVPEPGASSPNVVSNVDAPQVSPAPAADPYPSGACQNAGGTQLMNATLANGQAWVYEWQPDPNTIDVCARISGVGTAGGALSLSTDGSPGVTPVLSQGSDPSPCSLSVFTIATPPQAQSSLSVSPAGANPATICVGTGSTMHTYTLGSTGSAKPPMPQFTPDPGTP
jgi:hypothetical protein